MRILDRTLFFAYLKAYAIVLTCLLSLYIILDLFTNLEDFAQHVQGFTAIMEHIGRYYGYRVMQYFDRLCEAITLLAAMFTVAWMQRNNELLPLLSRGRADAAVIWPVLLGAGFMLCLGIANQEFVIPQIADALLADRDDPEGDKSLPVGGAFEPNGVHIEGTKAIRRAGSIAPLYVTFPEYMTGGLVHMSVDTAYFTPSKEGDLHAGGWLLTGGPARDARSLSASPRADRSRQVFSRSAGSRFRSADPEEQLVHVRIDGQAARNCSSDRTPNGKRPSPSCFTCG